MNENPGMVLCAHSLSLQLGGGGGRDRRVLGGSAARETKPNTVNPLSFLEYDPVLAEVLGCGYKLGQLTKSDPTMGTNTTMKTSKRSKGRAHSDGA